jgi:hypothetical protein
MVVPNLVYSRFAYSMGYFLSTCNLDRKCDTGADVLKLLTEVHLQRRETERERENKDAELDTPKSEC